MIPQILLSSINKNLKYFGLSVLCLVCWLNSFVLATQLLQDEQLYQKGILFRNQKKFDEAIDCFKFMAEKGDTKAQHNLAFCFYESGDEQKAYDWYKCASDRGFIPSKNNLQKLNLLLLLLPNELLSYIACHLPMADLYHFGTTSKKSHFVFDSIVTRTNFLISQDPYANDFYKLFQNVIFDPSPREIRWARLIKADTIEIHFRNSDHLKTIVDKTCLFRSKNNVYFFQDPNVKDNEELISPDSHIIKRYFIHIVSDNPVNIAGNLILPYDLHLPEGSCFNRLNYQGKSISTGRLKIFYDAYDLAQAIDTFDESLLKIRTRDAQLLLEDCQKKRIKFPEFFPGFIKLCPQIYFISDSEITIEQKDYISATELLIYRANSIAALNKLKLRLPDFFSSIYYIDPEHDLSGVYCSGPLHIQKGFKISSEQDLTVTGSIDLNDYNLEINTNNSLWSFGLQLKVANFKFNVSNYIYLGNINAPLKSSIKPENMPEEAWIKLKQLLYQLGYF